MSESAQQLVFPTQKLKHLNLTPNVLMFFSAGPMFLNIFNSAKKLKIQFTDTHFKLA